MDHRTPTTTAAAGDEPRAYLSGILACVIVAGGVAACDSNRTAPSVATTSSVEISVIDLPGAWGLASYHTAADKDRTEAQAKVACGNPYQIGQGPNGGVIMHLAGKPQPQEVFLKVSPDGRTYLGPRGAPGMPQDRLVVSFDNGVLTTDWVDPGAQKRYGTMVFVRCAA